MKMNFPACAPGYHAKVRFFSALKNMSAAAGCSALFVMTLGADEPLPRKPENVSFRNEVGLAIEKGLSWLQSQQKEDGSWSNNEHPALTALALLAFQREPTGRERDKQPASMRKGFEFLRRNAKPDGGIYAQGLSNYNTSLALTALLTSGRPEDQALIDKAREFIVAQQASGMANPALDGGIGYGPTGVSPKRKHPDLDNTVVSLEALQNFRRSFPTREIPASSDLNWKAAIDFITRCQNLPSHNPDGSSEAKDKGGFIYYPGFSNADPADLPPGARRPLRSYGSMTYAGLLSFIYAGLSKDDPRVTAAIDWLKRNYTLEENPGIGPQGLFYHYHLMAKALATAGINELETAEGGRIDWARQLGLKLVDLQKSDGSWINDQSARWMEKDPVLVTSYCVMALEIVYRQL
jgi:squalene-hopene/tetraprenyl-beta-curcumene cyclase